MDPTQSLELGVSEFVAVLNQSMEFALPNVTITGELANLRVSKNRWVYFDLKDETATVKFFGTVYQLPGPLEDGMLLSVQGQPRLHPLYGFSVTVQNMRPTGEGSIRKAADLLQAKLLAEGLFDPTRKRGLPYPPQHIGLITSGQSAAYADFMKILAARWQGVSITHVDVQVQGAVAPDQIVAAIEQCNELAEPPEVLVIIRGGGSAEDLAAFSTEKVTRAVAASRVPTLVAIGHEIDLSLAELAADARASTPSNAAELLVPDKVEALRQLLGRAEQLEQYVQARVTLARKKLVETEEELHSRTQTALERAQLSLRSQAKLLAVLSPEAILKRGFAIVRDEQGRILRSVRGVATGAIVEVRLADGQLGAQITDVKKGV